VWIIVGMYARVSYVCTYESNFWSSDYALQATCCHLNLRHRHFTFMLTLVSAYTCAVSWLLLVKLSVLAKWLARKTPLRKPNCGEIVSIKPRQNSVYYVLVLLYCFTVWLHDKVVLSAPAIRDIFHTAMAQHSLFVLNVPVNTDD